MVRKNGKLKKKKKNGRRIIRAAKRQVADLAVLEGDQSARFRIELN